MATTLTVGGNPVSLARYQLDRCTFFSKKGIGTLSFFQRGGPLPSSPDPFLAKEVVLTMSGTVRFRGDVTAAHPTFSTLGWKVGYQCMDLRFRGDKIPHVDPATGTQRSSFNLQIEDPLYNPSNAGRTVGQILTVALTGADNGAALTAHGIGNLTLSGGVYSLPSATMADLAALAVIPPCSVTFGGDKLLTALESFLHSWAPNHMMWIDPSSGSIRFLDTRTFSGHTLTMGTDPIDPTPLSRDLGACFQKVSVGGRPIAVMALLKTSNGTLTEDFGHDGLSNAAAKAAWTAGNWNQPGDSQDSGTVTCTSTTTIQYHSSNASRTYAANALDQSHRQATITLSSTIISDYTQFWSSRVVANTALTAGGTMTLTPDHALPHTSFDHATLTMQAQSASVVWTQYKIANTNLWPRVTNQATYAAPLLNAAGGVTLISSPMGFVLRSDGVTAPAPFTYNAATGQLRFLAPTFVTGNNAAPADVWACIPVWTNPLQVVSPSTGYAGTSNTVDGMRETLSIFLDSWRDPAQASQVQAFSDDLLDSVKDAVVEGTVVYHGLYATALAPGVALSVAGSNYTTGWESSALPIVEMAVEWLTNGPTNHLTTLRCSNRRAALSSAAFLKPARSFMPIGANVDPFGGLEYGVLAPGFQVGFPTSDQAPGDFGTYSPSGPAGPTYVPSTPAEFLSASGAPLAQFAGPAGIPAGATAPYQTIGERIAAARARPDNTIEERNRRAIAAGQERTRAARQAGFEGADTVAERIAAGQARTEAARAQEEERLRSLREAHDVDPRAVAARFVQPEVPPVTPPLEGD